MTITGAITASAINFGYGLYQGIKGREEEMELDMSLVEHLSRMKIKDCENCSKPKRCEDYDKAKAKIEKIEGLKAHLPFLKYLPMGLAGAMYLTISNISDPSLENALPLVSGLAGRYIGARVWKRKNQERIQRYEKMAQAQDVEAIAEGLATPEQRKAVEDTLSTLETRLLQDKEVEDDEFEAIMKKGYDVITKDSGAYTPFLLNWSLKKFKKGLERMKMQKNLKSLYDEDRPGAAIVGVPENPQVIAYVKQGDKILVQDVNFGEFNIESRDMAHGTAMKLRFPKPKVETTETLPVEENYRNVASHIISRTDKKTRMILNFPEGAPEAFRDMMLTTTFLPAFEGYHRMKSEHEAKTKDKSGGCEE